MSDECIAQIAAKTFTQHLEQFAITLLGLRDVQYDHAVNDAGQDSWKRCCNVSIDQLFSVALYVFTVLSWNCIQCRLSLVFKCYES